MAISENSIGPYPFIVLNGEPIPPAATKVIDDRPGVDGSELVLTGVKGRPFSLISQVDAESYEAGKTYHAAYRSLISGDAVELVQGGVSTHLDGYAVSVLAVEPIRILTILSPVGNGLHPPSQGWVEMRWDLISVPLDE